MEKGLMFLLLLFYGFPVMAFSGIIATGPDKDSISHFTQSGIRIPDLECDPQILLTTQELLSINLYWAKNAIRASGYKMPQDLGKNVTMKAGFTIVLKPGTVIGKGNYYLARIEECIPSCTDSFIADTFFTPNADGSNDYWNIHNLDNITAVEVYIYDRYGKLITKLKPNTPGWDGTFNGYPMPATDYWYVMNYTNCYGQRQQSKSHFSLIR